LIMLGNTNASGIQIGSGSNSLTINTSASNDSIVIEQGTYDSILSFTQPGAATQTYTFANGGTIYTSGNIGTLDHGALSGLLDDDHTQYQKESERNAANGYAGLDANSLISKNHALDLVRNSGFVGDLEITDNNNGTVTVADQDVYFYENGVFGSRLIKYTLAGGTTGTEFPALPDTTTSYLVAKYNAGSPVFEFITDKSLIDYETYLPHTTVYRSGTRVHTQNWDLTSYALAEKMAYRNAMTEEYARESGLQISTRDNTGTPEFQVEAGVVWTDD